MLGSPGIAEAPDPTPPTSLSRAPRPFMPDSWQLARSSLGLRDIWRSSRPHHPMRIAIRKNANSAEQRREQMLSERSGSAALRQAYPHVAELQIELVFSDSTGHPPSPQRHTLYPAAPAFFRFTCPCADCDAEFDLTPNVAKLLDGTAGRQRAATVSGQMSCEGVRMRDRLGSTACSMQLNFRLVTASSSKHAPTGA